MDLKLTPAELKHGMVVEARFSRMDNEHGTHPIWSEWRDVALYVRRREKVIKPKPKFSKKSHAIGAIIELGVSGDWASYDEDDYSADYDEWLSEDYRMQLRRTQ